MARHLSSRVKNQLLAAKVKSIKKEIKDDIIIEVNQYLDTLPNEIGNMVISAIQESSLTINLNHESKKTFTKTWFEIIVTPLAMVFAILLSFFLWYFIQLGLMEDTSLKEKQFVSNLSLREEYTRRRFDTYEEVNKYLHKLENTVFSRTDKSLDEIPQSMRELRDVIESKKIYFSDTIWNLSDNLRKDVLDFCTDSKTSISPKKIENQINTLKIEMKKELEVNPYSDQIIK